jgi:Skp family chaperone for outer membrane proteins
MKGILQVVAALLLLNVAALALWSRAAPPPPAARTTRVAVFNMSRVIKNYEKFKIYQAELAQKIDPFQKRDYAWKAEGAKLAEKAQQPMTTDSRPKPKEIEKRLEELVRLIEGNKAEAQKVLIEEQERQLVSLYTDVEAVASRVAKQRGYDLVLHHRDVAAKGEWSAQSITRKPQEGPLVAIYIDPTIDLTDSILEELHEDMKKERR